MTSHLDVSALESWLGEAACVIRGPVDAPKRKDDILPLICLTRLSVVFDDDIDHLAHDFGDRQMAATLVEQDHQLVRCDIPEHSRWSTIGALATGPGQALTNAVRALARENPRLSGVLDVTDVGAATAGPRMVDDGRLAALVQVLNYPCDRLGLADGAPDLLGRAHADRLRAFAEAQGQSAGECSTPREVAVVMARLLDPRPGLLGGDPCGGSGGRLLSCHVRLVDTQEAPQNGRRTLPAHLAPLTVFGQEINPSTLAMSRMKAVIHDLEAEIALDDTKHRPAFTGVAAALVRGPRKEGAETWTSRHPVEGPDTDQELQAPFHVADPEDIDKGGPYHGHLASIRLWSHHGLTDAPRHALKTIGRFDCRWPVTPMLDALETDGGVPLRRWSRGAGGRM
jgi:type I restriction enzyme M protein